MQMLKDIVKVNYDRVGLCGLWQATYASYTAYEIEASKVNWASSWEEQKSFYIGGRIRTFFCGLGGQKYFTLLPCTRRKTIPRNQSSGAATSADS